MIVNGKWVDGWRTPHRRVNPKGRGSFIYRKESLFKAYPTLIDPAKAETMPFTGDGVIYSGMLVKLNEAGQWVVAQGATNQATAPAVSGSNTEQWYMVLGEQSNDPDVVAAGKLAAADLSLNVEVDLPGEFFDTETNAEALKIGDWLTIDKDGKYVKYVFGSNVPVVGRVTEAYRAIGVGIECEMNQAIANPQQKPADRIVSVAGSPNTPAIETNSDTKGVVTVATWWYPNGINTDAGNFTQTKLVAGTNIKIVPGTADDEGVDNTGKEVISYNA